MGVGLGFAAVRSAGHGIGDIAAAAAARWVGDPPQPCQAALRGGQQPFCLLFGQAPAAGLRENGGEQKSCLDAGAARRQMWPGVPESAGNSAEIRPWRGLLATGERAQRACGELGAQGQEHPGGP